MTPSPPKLLLIERRLIDEFKVAAKKAHPREEYAVLLGTHSGGRRRKAIVTALWWPDDRWRTQTATETGDVHEQHEWMRRVRGVAKAQGLVVLGDFHSHPYVAGEGNGYTMDRAPSEGDWKRAPAWWIHGIMVVDKLTSGRFRCSPKFWVGNPEFEVEVVA